MSTPASQPRVAPQPRRPRRPIRPATWRDVVTPPWIVWFARRLGIAAVILVIALALVPWPQAAPARGAVTVIDPLGRDQTIQSPIDGFVSQWHIREGDRVEEGQLIAELRDNDPERLTRLEAQRDTLKAQIQAAEAKVVASEQKVFAARLTQQASVAAARADLAAAKRDVEAARADVLAAEALANTASIQSDRARELATDGLTSEQDAENRLLSYDTARAQVVASKAKLTATRAKQDALAAKVEATERSGDGAIATAEGQRLEAVAKLEDLKAKLFEQESRIATQATQEIRAPFDGLAIRVFGGARGEQLKKGQDLIRIIPSVTDRFIELTVIGNDAALVRVGQQVRVQFEGWPALQFAGWPVIAPGTFAARVRMLEPVADENGNFRVLAEPDPDCPESHEWPPSDLLPQGLRASAWIILGEVPLGYEIWRRLNGFPPIMDPPKRKMALDPVDASKARKAWSIK